MHKHDTCVKDVATQTQLKVQVAFHILDYLDRTKGLSVYTTNIGRIQIQVLTTLPMAI